MGAHIIVCEVDPIRGLEAAMDGFRVMPIAKAAREGELFITVTGNMHVVSTKHFPLMRDGATVCNAGHFDIEVDVKGLAKIAKKVNRGVRGNVDEYVLASGRRIHVLSEGRLVNLAAAEGHPASVMDMSFATQALAAEWACKRSKKGELTPKVYKIPESIEKQVATLKISGMGFRIDRLTPEQKVYLSSWNVGT